MSFGAWERRRDRIYNVFDHPLNYSNVMSRTPNGVEHLLEIPGMAAHRDHLYH